MSRIEKRHSKWTYEEIVKEALKYKTRTLFSKGSSGAYTAASNKRF